MTCDDMGMNTTRYADPQPLLALAGALAYAANGFTPGEAAAWKALNFYPGEALAWADAGFTPDTANAACDRHHFTPAAALAAGAVAS